MSQTLTTDQKEAMRAVRDGADVFDYHIARRLREVQQIDKTLINIGPAQGDYGDGSGKEPYFGAILTSAGKRTIKEQ